jgi:hypothetical protein
MQKVRDYFYFEYDCKMMLQVWRMIKEERFKTSFEEIDKDDMIDVCLMYFHIALENPDDCGIDISCVADIGIASILMSRYDTATDLEKVDAIKENIFKMLINNYTFMCYIEDMLEAIKEQKFCAAGEMCFEEEYVPEFDRNMPL